MVKQETLMFFTGFFSCALLLYSAFYVGLDIPLGTGMASAEEVPSDWINEKDILVNEDSIIINIPGVTISNYAPTGSMRPLLDEGSNGIRIRPENPEDIGVGDIVSFIKDNKMMVHRIIGVGSDEQGQYYITQGDNNSINDGKIRFSEIRYVTIGILW